MSKRAFAMYELNCKLEIQSSWELPTISDSSCRFKVDQQTFYLTVWAKHQIRACNFRGKVLNTWGTTNKSSNKGEFHMPIGITVNAKYAYVCDSYNHRIQILDKKNGEYVTQWGHEDEGKSQFKQPTSICYVDHLFYIGDSLSIQIITSDGLCQQRLGDSMRGGMMHQFSYVYGVCVVNDRLYASDCNNRRIQVYQPKQ